MFLYWHFFNIQTILRAHNLQTIQATHPPLRFTGLNQKNHLHPFKASDAGIMNSTVEEAEDWTKRKQTAEVRLLSKGGGCKEFFGTSPGGGIDGRFFYELWLST